MKFGDAITVKNGTSERLAVYLWRPDGSEPSIFLAGRVVHPDLGAILSPWACPQCRGVQVFWGIRIPPRCATCYPPTTVEREHLLSYAVACVKGLAAKLDDKAAKVGMHRLLDETVSTGDVRQLVALSLECLVGGFTLKHHGGQS
ncbi:MAG: hypothetical protein CAF44_009765 [Nitrospira sp. CG24D]|nr:MAG: hypothetical protein CAF44_009765 [Nitrospira sp. CG24D]